LKKKGDKVQFAYLKTYDDETVRILEEAKKEYAGMKQKGYTREQAFEDFSEGQKQIDKHL